MEDDWELWGNLDPKTRAVVDSCTELVTFLEESSYAWELANPTASPGGTPDTSHDSTNTSQGLFTPAKSERFFKIHHRAMLRGDLPEDDPVGLYSILLKLHRSFMEASGKHKYLHHCAKAAEDAVAYFRHLACVLETLAQGHHRPILRMVKALDPKCRASLYIMMNHNDQLHGSNSRQDNFSE